MGGEKHKNTLKWHKQNLFDPLNMAQMGQNIH